MEHTHIVTLLWQRSEAALTALAKAFGLRLKRTAVNILTDPLDAEEAVNDTYLALWNQIPPEKPDPLEGYVYMTGRNIALKMLRYRNAQKRSAYTVSLDELAQILPGNDLEETMNAKALGMAIDAFLSTVSQTNRRVFLRRYWFGDSLQELAREEYMSVNALTVRLSRLRTQLREYLQKEGLL